MRKRQLADQAAGTTQASAKPRWHARPLALAAAVLLGVASAPAFALGLGRVTVQSALGEPLRAQIEITDITPEELASLRTDVASPDAFRARGVDYNAALASATVTLERRPDGRAVLSVRSPRVVNDPFLDLILETSWSSGRITRDYTLLFDPPTLRQPAQPLQAQAGQTFTPTAPGGSAARAATAPAPAAPAVAGRRGTPRDGSAPAGKAPSGDGRQVTVQAGDTAGKIAAASRPEGVSLDQMLVAMLRANPDAFVSGNVNRLRAGAVIDMPSAEQAGQVDAADAHRTLVAQSRDFNEFRRRLAESVPGTGKAAQGERQSSGQVTAQVEDKRPAATAPDKLTLSKGSAKPGSAEDKIAREKASQDTATRVAELNRNIADLNKVGSPQASGPAGGTGAGQGVTVPVGAASLAKPAAPASSPASAPAAAPASAAMTAPAAAASAAAPAEAASAAASAASAATPALAVAKPTKPVVKKPAPPPPPEPSLFDDLLDNPLVPAGAGGILALLLGLGAWKWRQRRKAGPVDSSYLESRLQPDSFFGASGGQRVDTAESGAPTGSSMVYSPSQLDAAGDVDPVAEADVYLAYGRDLQAEEILKEALRGNPQRTAIHSKLLEIYAKRRDTKSFEALATQAHMITQGAGPDWEHICELGQELDPSNDLYRGGRPAGAGPAALAATGALGAAALATQVLPASELPSATPDVDLDLDFSLDDAAPGAAPPAEQSTQALNPADVSDMPALDLDFDSASSASTQPIEMPTAPMLPEAAAASDDNGLSFDLELPPTAEPPAAATAAPAEPDAGMIEFDLGALALDLPGTSATEPAAMEAATSPVQATLPRGGHDEAAPSTAGLSLGGFDEASGDPLATKLALAQEFNAIGDPDGARSLAQEVIAEASGELKSRAQKFLAEIG